FGKVKKIKKAVKESNEAVQAVAGAIGTGTEALLDPKSLDLEAAFDVIRAQNKALKEAKEALDAIRDVL
ncbi:MAG: hypothetical protein OXQ29_06640, partial [Rhodospirillaceae bacterium]|nr:hypothetical protein [Rhodospirillaceae bacterium]